MDLASNTVPGSFLIGYTGAAFKDLFPYKWRIDSDALDGEIQGAGMAAIQVTGLEPGAHTLYVQAIDAQGKASEVEEIPFEVK